ncbi:MAG: disulfide bond formation protein B [Beijerinckiaceae bacterium]|nr:disulfide bond formation protein B [Beijerinckiaceae bacterium]
MPPLPKLSRFALAALTLALPVAAIAGAFAFQAAGFAPCELCLKERLPYYAGIVLGVVAVLLAWRGSGVALTACFAVLALLFLGSAGFGAYHAGVEWGFWPGPGDCTGALDRPPSMADFMKQLQTIKVVRCDAVAIRILGLSLAGWNAVVSLAVAGLATAGAARRNVAALAAEAPAR